MILLNKIEEKREIRFFDNEKQYDKIRAVLFDFDGVLTIDATGSHSICNYISEITGIDIAILKNEYYKYNNDLLYGIRKHEDIWKEFCEGIGVYISIQILRDSFINTPIDHGMFRLLTQLKEKGYKIGMVTDNKSDRIKTITKFYNWNQLFDNISISAEIGSGKEEELIFVNSLENIGLQAEECVFIDNQEKNLLVPKRMGMNVIYYNHRTRDLNQLIMELNQLGIAIS